MKKILTLLLVLVLSLSVMVGCDKIPGLDGIKLPSLEDIKLPGIGDLIPGMGDNTPEHEHNFVDGECECGEKDPNYVPVPEVDADLQSAADFIHMSAKEILKETGANYELPTAASVGTKTYTAEWTVDNELVTFAPHADKENVIVVNIPKVYENVEYTIKFVIKNENGEEVSREYKHIIPAFKVASFEEYMDAEKGDVLTVKGIVAAMCSKGAGAKRNHVYVIDESGVGGYLNYNMVDDPATLGVEVGMTVLINGEISPSNGMQEFYQGTVEIIDETIKEVPASDITSIFAEGGSLDNYVARLVTIKGVTLGNQDLSTANSQYLYFTLGEEKAYIRTYITDFPSSLEIVVGADGIATSPAKDAIDAFHAAHFGWTADVTGILVYYSGSPYLVPVSIDCFTNLKEVERSASEKVATSIENVTVVDEIKEDTVLDLPLVGLYDDVTISWTVNSTAVSFIEDGKLEVKLGETEVTLTLTATFTCGEVSETKEYTILVGAASSQQYITKSTSDVKEGVAYKFGLVQAKLGETLYLTGEVDGRYLVTTKYLDEAVDVYAEAAENGYKFYILVDEAKQYITVYNNADGKLSVKFDAAGTSVYAYNATVNAWVTNMDGTDYYLGTYNEFNTVSASKLTYITAENTGVSQFPANFYELTLKETAIVNKPSVEEGVDYKFGLVQAKLGETLYLTGEVDGRYLVTTKYYDEAVNVYVEAVDNGYKFYILVDEAKQYITVYNNADGKLSVKFDAAGTSVYAYNATVNAWVTNMDGTDYYLGTYNEFNTVSASKLTYITAENTGVSQFPANFFRYEFVTEEPACNHANTTTTTVDATCTAAGSTTVTCTDCGATVSTTELPKLDHTYVDGECSCGAKDPSLNGAPVETPVAGTAYKFGMVQGNLDNAIYYLAGGMNGYYLETTNDASKALDVYLEETTGGYYLYCYVNGAKTYINMVVSGTHVNGAYEATASTVYTYNTEKKTIVSVVDGSDYWMGTRNDKTYTTVGPVKVEYDGFYCQFYAVKTTETPHEHVYVDGKCECGEEDPNYVPPTVDPNPTESTTVTVVIADYATANKWENSTLYDAIVIDGNVTVKATGTAVGTWGLNTGKYYTSGNNWRIYQNENPEVTISGADGVTIISVKITYAVKNTGTLTLNGENIASETVVTVNANSVTFSVGNTGTATNGQAQITAIEVVYSGGTSTPVDPQPPVHEHTFVDGKCACGEEDPNYVPPAGPVEVTIPEALELADNTEIIVKGTVSEINTAWSDQYNNITVTIVDADGNKLYLYRLATKVGVGDVITVTGKMGTHNNSRQVAAGATAVIDVAHVCSQWTDATCTAPKTCVVCGATTGELADHVYVNGKCECGAEQGVTYVTESLAIAASTGSLAADSLSISWTGDNLTVTTEKAASTNAIRTSDADHFRAYKGSLTTISGSKITKIVITCTSSDYATVCAGSLTTEGVTATVSGTVVTITVNSGTVDSVVISATAQWRFNNVEITHQ